MGLGDILSRRPSRRSRNSGVYYNNQQYLPSNVYDYDNPNTISDPNKLTAFQAATAAAGASSRSNSMTSVSGAAAAAALRGQVNSPNLSRPASVNGGRTMSLSSRTFRNPDQLRRSNSLTSSSTVGHSHNPYLQRKQQQQQHKQQLYGTRSGQSNTPRLNSLNSNSARPTARFTPGSLIRP
ncbi:unnamed protein product [Ambrosiozyma monospora]|uniref:Unnamed protein product n=1 Tax=Ambrosiozyma monospora TaxID=43982 RepID=A0ACB5SY43_AMBMO|nr:unnamed protein product [Ambrosiozyma monospora]